MFIIAGLYRHQKLIAPQGAQTRPTSSRLRESLFNICQSSIENASFLDLFAGSGAIGLEALSRGASQVTFIESHVESAHCIKKNCQKLNVLDSCQILIGDVFKMLERLQKQNKTFDLIFADPPYQTLASSSSLIYSQALLEWIEKSSLLNPNGCLFIEEDHRFKPSIDQLVALEMKSSRRIGPATLMQFVNEKKN